MDVPNQMPSGVNPVPTKPDVVIRESTPHKNKPVIMVLILVVLFALGWYLYSSMSGDGKIKPKLQASAAQGETVVGIPNDLILLKDAQVLDSKYYTTELKEGNLLEVFTVDFSTYSTFPYVLTAYMEYMGQNGYEVKNSQSASDNGRLVGTRKIDGRFYGLIVAVSRMEDSSTRVRISFNQE